MRQYLEQVRKKAPLVHNITNYVTANDVANALLACGASPIMADEPAEVEEITASCAGLTINLGTLSERSVLSMEKAGKVAEQLGHVILLDPVGVGASTFRRQTAEILKNTIHFDVIRANMSEIKTLAQKRGTSRGVDAAIDDCITEQNLDHTISFVREFARKNKCIVAVTGAIDLVTDGTACYVLRGGRPEMSLITGTGCQLSGIMTAYVAANREQKLEAAAAAVCAMNLAGEIAWNHMRPEDGNATYRNRIIDALFGMDGEMLERGANYEVR